MDKDPTKSCQYCAIELDSHRRLIKLCNDVFGESDAKIKWGHKTYVTRFPAVINTPLRLSGVHHGDKRLTNSYVPKDIFENQEFMKVYKEKGFFKFGDLGKELVKIGRSYDLAGRYLVNLTKKGLIKKIKYGHYVFTNTH